MVDNSSSKVLDFEGAKLVELKNKVHKCEVKTGDDVENVVKEKLLTKVVMEETPLEVEFSTWVKEDGQQQQTHKGALLKVEPSSLAQSKLKEFIKM